MWIRKALELDGKAALDHILRVTWASKASALTTEEQMVLLEHKIENLDRGHDSLDDIGALGVSRYSSLFNKKSKGPGVWNGFGITKTRQSHTLFVTNVPPKRLSEVRGECCLLP